MKNNPLKLSHNGFLHKNDALLIIDVQNDFLPDGNLAVIDGNIIIPVLNHAIKTFESLGLPIFFSRDWHPDNHCSFRQNNGIWPNHCIQNTWGAEFASTLHIPKTANIISKATLPNKDSYSAFEETNLHSILRSKKIKRVFIGGLATEYCVLHTVHDACALGYSVCVLEDGIKAVNVLEDDERNALKTMQDLAVIFV